MRCLGECEWREAPTLQSQLVACLASARLGQFQQAAKLSCVCIRCEWVQCLGVDIACLASARMGHFQDATKPSCRCWSVWIRCPVAVVLHNASPCQKRQSRMPATSRCQRYRAGDVQKHATLTALYQSAGHKRPHSDDTRQPGQRTSAGAAQPSWTYCHLQHSVSPQHAAPCSQQVS